MTNMNEKSTRAQQKAAREHVAAEGRVVIVIGPLCWGKGKDGKTALRNARRECPSYIDKKDVRFYVLDCPGDAYVTDMGGISWKDASAERDKVLAIC